MTFRVEIVERRYATMYVEADDWETAESIALDTVRDGDFEDYRTSQEVIDIEAED